VKENGFAIRRLGAIYAGGVLGALVRVGLAETFPHGSGAWPWATLAVNLAGALALGYLAAKFHDRREEDLSHPFLTAGLCGTLTTFATIQLELFEMVDAGRLGLAVPYALVTLAAGYSLLRLGEGLARRREAA
jgi:fluoride exporter